MFKELNIMKPFLESPTREFNVREASRLLKISPATASKELLALSKRGLLRERKERRFIFYQSDTESEKYRDFKIFYNINKIRESGLLESLNKFYLKPSVMLFGSAAHGLDTETSDFDLVVLSEKTSVFQEKAKFDNILNRNLQIFNCKSLKDFKNEHLINSMLNGIVIQGEIKWI